MKNFMFSELDQIERFVAKVDKSSGDCWIWTGSANNGGYGTFSVRSGDGKNATWMAHRFSYFTYVGQIPEGWQIDHLCTVRLCVNPKHLEAVTPKENMRRIANGKCKNGHLVTEENVYMDRKTGRGRCRECHRKYNREYYHKKKWL